MTILMTAMTCSQAKDNDKDKTMERQRQIQIVQVADIGDVRANLYNLTAMADEVTKQYEQIFRCWNQTKNCVKKYTLGAHLFADFLA